MTPVEGIIEREMERVDKVWNDLCIPMGKTSILRLLLEARAEQIRQNRLEALRHHHSRAGATAHELQQLATALEAAAKGV